MNMSIRCEITECRYNNVNERYCTLDTIEIVRNDIGHQNSQEHTDCGCFEPR